MIFRKITYILVLAFCGVNFFSLRGNEDRADILASEFAERGGKISMFLGQYPKSFNYHIDHTQSSEKIFTLLFQPLFGLNPHDLQEDPILAKSWEVSEDRKQITFKLDENARWSDGKTITADDVIWTFEAMKNPKHLTGPYVAVLSRLTKAEKIDDLTVRFHASESHWKNLQACGSFFILPKHWWEKQKDFNKVNFKFDVVCGPYKIKETKEQHSVKLERLPNYWANEKESMQGILNFDEIEYRFYTSRDVAYEEFKKGEIDLFAVYTARRWVEETAGERFQKNWIVKQAIYNYDPQGFQGFAMNMRREPYNDKRVRRALAYLLDRKRMNETLMYSQYNLSNSYYADLYSPENPCQNVQFDFNPKKAKELLKEAGWKINSVSGKLEKNGKAFVIDFLTRDPSTNKFVLIYQEALKNVGIELKITQKDWASWVKDMDEFNYDMTWSAWGAVPFKDPEPMWHSKFKEVKASNNITGFSNPEVDKLIEKTKTIYDVKERHAVVREIDKLIFEEVPYVLLWNLTYTRLLYWNKFGMPEQVLGKYIDADEFGALRYWWLDFDQEADLENAVTEKTTLPEKPLKVIFDSAFTE